jgi:hypothetical protein
MSSMYSMMCANADNHSLFVLEGQEGQAEAGEAGAQAGPRTAAGAAAAPEPRPQRCGRGMDCYTGTDLPQATLCFLVYDGFANCTAGHPPWVPTRAVYT